MGATTQEKLKVTDVYKIFIDLHDRIPRCDESVHSEHDSHGDHYENVRPTDACENVILHSQFFDETYKPER
mgnify:CR=1 FL=1